MVLSLTQATLDAELSPLYVITEWCRGGLLPRGLKLKSFRKHRLHYYNKYQGIYGARFKSDISHTPKWSRNVANFNKLSSLAAPRVVTLTISGATSDANFLQNYNMRFSERDEKAQMILSRMSSCACTLAYNIFHEIKLCCVLYCCNQRIYPCRKWPPIRRHYFQMHSRERKVLYSDLFKISLNFISKGPIDKNAALVKYSCRVRENRSENNNNKGQQPPIIRYRMIETSMKKTSTNL